MSTNKTLQRELGLTGITSDNPFQTTLFGWQFLLVGVDASERIVYRHPLHKEARTGGQELNPYIAINDYDSHGHPRTSRYRAHAQELISQKHFQLISEGLHSVRSLDDTTHSVTDWYLLGIDGNDPVDTAPYAGTAPEGEQGNGRYGIGAVLNDTVRADMTNTGRMWLHWQGDPVGVSASSALPFLFTRQDDGSLRLVKTHWDRETGWDSTKKVSTLAEAGSTALMSFDLNQLFDGDASMSDIPAIVRDYGEEMVRRSLDLDHAAGIDSQHPVSPLVELPAVYEKLVSLQDSVDAGGNLLSDFERNTTDIGLAHNHIYADTVWGYAWHRTGFTWPSDGRGVKWTLSVSAQVDHPDYGIIFKIAGMEKAFINEAPVLRVQDFRQETIPNLSMVGTDDGTRSSYVFHHHQTKRDAHTAQLFDSMNYDRYEIYVYPDQRAYVYRDGRYAGQLIIPEHLITPGKQYTFGAVLRLRRAYFREMSVEAFDVPASYAMNPPAPAITGVDLSHTRSESLDPEVLLGTVDNGVVSFRHAVSDEREIEFNVTTASRLSVFMRPGYRGELSLRRQYPVGSERPYDAQDPLDPVNLSSFLTGETPVNDWYTFPFVLPAGRYLLRVEAAVDDPTYTQLRRWRIDPVDSDQPMLVDTWPLGATFEGDDIASTLNSEQLEYEADVNGVHLHNENDSFSFVVTYDAKLRIHPHTNAGRVRLHRVDGKDLSLESDQLVSGQWYEFPYRIPAGKYQLSGIGSEQTTLTGWEALAPVDLPDAPQPAMLPSFEDVVTSAIHGANAVRALSDGITHDESSDHKVGLRSTYPIEFDVLEDSILSVHNTGNVGYNGSYGRVRLYRLDGDNTRYVVGSPSMRKRSWYAFPVMLTPGRYRMNGLYSSETAELTEWHLSPANQLQQPSAPVVYDIDGSQTTWRDPWGTSDSNAHLVLSDGVVDGYGDEFGVLLSNYTFYLDHPFLRFRLSKPGSLVLTPHTNIGPVTLSLLDDAGTDTPVATVLLAESGKPSSVGYELPAGKYKMHAHGSGQGAVALNQLAAEVSTDMPDLPPRATATVVASVGTDRTLEVTASALTDGHTPAAHMQGNLTSGVPLKDGYVEFTLDQVAVMCTYLSRPEHGVVLKKVVTEGETVTEVPVYAHRPTVADWTNLPFNMEAGTYRLYGAPVKSADYGPLISQWAFSVPQAGYTTTPPPSIIDVDASGVYNFTEDTNWDLIDGSTDYDPAESLLRCAILKAAVLDGEGAEISPASNVVWFTLVQDADLSLFAVNGNTDPVRLLSEDGTTIDLTTGDLASEGWTSFDQTIPAGRYQLIGQGTTYITEIKAEAPAPAA